MKFDMKTPCKDCPFLVGSSTNQTLREGRLEEIVDGIRSDGTFQCHKTLEENIEDQHCAGALVFIEREGTPNNMVRVAERLGLYDHKKLDMEAPIIDPADY